MECPRLLPFTHLALLFLISLTLADDPFFDFHCISKPGNYTPNSPYQANLNSIFSLLISPTTDFNYGFYNLSAGENPDQVYAMALCRGDRTQDVCISFLNETIAQLKQRCPMNKEAIGWHENCTLRYANRDMFGEMEYAPQSCNPSGMNASNPDQFNQALDQLLSNLSGIAADGGHLRKFAAGNLQLMGLFQFVYAIVQCSPDVSQGDCGSCLTQVKARVLGCCIGKWGCRAFSPSCFMRFESVLFYENAVPLPSSPPPTSTRGAGKGNNTTHTIIIIVASVVGVLTVITIAISIFIRRRTGPKCETADDNIKAETLQMDFAIVQVATDNFSDANKLGQGGFGAIYKR
ncbi:hypothetical protein COLO4_25169 [Corchorus olitorius]|uniref:Gnk2-homologous domain-containing protein n=1 Tax=Corchorus olitorius TaxID=93759 RepID=A0A1R3I4E3_9ROSI|nr:hypothetical protein COLO4_25169 [Corchorus olitorius]